MATRATTPTQIRIDSEVKKEANLLFDELGLDMSTAVNMFLKQCIMHHGLPFTVEVPGYSEQLVKSMLEAKVISRDPDTPSYSDMDSLKRTLEE